MKKEYVLFIDSGLGGLSTLAECIKRIKANYLYFADTKNAPYGEHNAKQITNYLISIIQGLKCHYKFKIVVIACNTATASAILTLRQIFKDLIFIGTEPAIKFAERLGYEKSLILTTPTTYNQPKFKNLISNYKNCKVLPLKKFATLIETYLYRKSINNYYHLITAISKIAIKAKNFDCIILGCTHYSIISKMIKKYCKKPCIDGNYGVYNMLSTKINENNSALSNKTSVKFILSKTDFAHKQNYKKILNQILANDLRLC